MRASLPKPVVLSVAYPFTALGPAAAGGAEQVLSTVESSIAVDGYESVVVAHAASQVSGTLVGVDVPEGVLTLAVRAEVERRCQRGIDLAFARFPIRLVHMHGIDFHCYRLPEDVPVLVTLHLPLAWYPSTLWALPARVRLQCVSESQRRTSPPEHRERLAVVGNGVPLPPPTRHRKGRFALILSRICSEKNLHVALDAARMAGIGVILAGEVFPYPEHLRYFDVEIRPRLGPGVRYIGPVGGEAKQRLLARASCLLLPTLAEETSSLVAMEAIAAGTAVVALPSGAIPEIVDDGRTGFLVRDVHAMADRLKRLDAINPAVCRAIARKRFSAQTMVERYLSLYEDLIA